jgi:hypothetical protein
MPFPFFLLMFSYAIWKGSIELAFDFNPAHCADRCAP